MATGAGWDRALQTDAGRVGPSRPLSPLWVTYAAGPRGRRSDRLRSAFHRLSPGSDGGLSPGSDGGRPQAWAGPTAPEAPLQLRPLGGLRSPPGPCGHQRASALTADPAGLLQRMPRVPDSDPHPQHRTQPGPGRTGGVRESHRTPPRGAPMGCDSHARFSCSEGRILTTLVKRHSRRSGGTTGRGAGAAAAAFRSEGATGLSSERTGRRAARRGAGRGGGRKLLPADREGQGAAEPAGRESC